jgi:predicted TIM-barrel fold metal-dependent hydrolase
MLIDAHCHFFTKKVLSSVDNIEKMITRVDKISKLIDVEKKNLKNSSILGLNVMDFFKMGWDNSVYDLYTHMRDSYGQDFIAVPLMLDLSFASSNPDAEQLPPKTKRRFAEVIKSKTNELTDKSPKLLNVMSNIEDRYHAFERSVTGADIFNDSYKNQIDDLTSIKNKIPDRVFPFFSIDPRRDNEFEHGVLGEIKKYIGKDKPFAGLKLYSSLGYSPTDPVLYDDSNGECVYSYCQKNKIPITIHSSIEGFASLMDRNHIVGDIYYPPAGRPVPAQEVFNDGIVEYKKSMRSIYFDGAVGERLLTLNHPVLWRKVIEKYPRLI